MPNPNQISIRAVRLTTFGFLAALTIARLIFSTTFPLAADEAYYWEWSRHLAFGYYDQGPAIAWVIKLGVLIFGDNEFGVRSICVLMGFGTSTFIYLFCKDVFGDERLGLTMVLAHNAITIYSVGTLLALYDNPQLLFWVACLYFAALAIFNERPRAWYPAGIAAGLGMLTKYSAVLLPGLIFLYLAVTSSRRNLLKTKEPWLGAVFAALVFSPNLYWNAANDWTAFAHTLKHTQGEWNFTTFDFLGEQAGIVSPILFILMIIGSVAAFKKARRGDDRSGLLLWTSIPIFLLFLVISIKKRVYANWASPVYISALLAAGWTLWPTFQSPGRWRKWGIAGLALGYFVVVLAFFHAPIIRLVNLPVEYDATREVYGWPELKPAIQKVLDELPPDTKPFLFGVRYQITSLAGFYSPGPMEITNLFLSGERLNTYLYWHNLEGLKGRDGLGVMYYPIKPETKALFESAENILYLELKNVNGETAHRIGIYYCKGFKGADARPEGFLTKPDYTGRLFSTVPK